MAMSIGNLKEQGVLSPILRSQHRVMSAPLPAEPGTVQHTTLEMPDPNKAYYFGIRCRDAAGNESAIGATALTAKSQAVDTDGDGMPDLWETSHGLDPNADDSQDDADGDALTNIEEYEHRADPKDADTDNDSRSDSDEVGYGTEPADPGSFPSFPGDLNCDSAVDLSDAVIALQIQAAIFSWDFCFNDADGDGKIGLADAIYILRKVSE
jgi:hypothetical protein